MSKKQILDTYKAKKIIRRLAYQVYENNYQEKELIIIGICDNGYKLAEILMEEINSISKINTILFGLKLDKEHLKIPFSLENLKGKKEEKPKVENKVIILIDDVINSGKVMIHAVKYLLDFNIKRMSTLVLINRNYPKYPIGIHFSGLSLSTTINNHIDVDIKKDLIKVYLKT